MTDDWLWQCPDDLDAFDYARDFVRQMLLPDFGTVEANRKYLWTAFERDWFRPALELQVAGLTLLAGPLGNQTLAASFAASAIDHSLVGWNAALLSFPRVAYTLSRHVAEAAIFQIASVYVPETFAPLWNDNKATGGSVLRLLVDTIPNELHSTLATAWRFVVGFGHVSTVPVAFSKLGVPTPDGDSFRAVSFGGPHIGPLHDGVLYHLGGAYTLVAEAGTSAFASAFAERLAPYQRWREAYEDQQRKIHERMQV